MSPPSQSEYIPLTPPDSAAIHTRPAGVECDGLQSFFDDSGCEELNAEGLLRKRSKSSLRSFFSAALSDSNQLPVCSVSSCDKALPPTPVTGERPNIRQKRASTIDTVSFRRNDPSSERYPLFYTPPVVGRRSLDNSPLPLRAGSQITSEKVCESQVLDLIPRPTSFILRKAKQVDRNAPPPYPSPTSPLPPTPGFSTELPLTSTPKAGQARELDGPRNTSEESIDSMEILSWRMPTLKKQVSRGSTGSSTQAVCLVDTCLTFSNY